MPLFQAEEEQCNFDSTFLIGGFLKTFSEGALREPVGVFFRVGLGFRDHSNVCSMAPGSLCFLHSGMC